MRRRIFKRIAVPWALGIAGAAAALAIGVVVGVRSTPQPEPWPLPVSATATHGQDNFAICTGELEDGLDAIFFLDFLTGELRASALNVRTRHFQAFYQRSIVSDLGLKDIKNPRYLMVTGMADLQRTAGAQQRMGRAVVYVAELNSGICIAYAVPSVPPKANVGFQAAAPLVLVDRLQFRTVKIRD